MSVCLWHLFRPVKVILKWNRVSIRLTPELLPHETIRRRWNKNNFVIVMPVCYVAEISTEDCVLTSKSHPLPVLSSYASSANTNTLSAELESLASFESNTVSAFLHVYLNMYEEDTKFIHKPALTLHINAVRNYKVEIFRRSWEKVEC